MDDDHEDYSDYEEFNEDALTNEEYDLYHENLPKVKAEIAKHNPDISELDLKEALYENYFEIDPTVAELKQRFPKKKGMFIQFNLALFFYPNSFSSTDLR